MRPNVCSIIQLHIPAIQFHKVVQNCMTTASSQIAECKKSSRSPLYHSSYRTVLTNVPMWPICTRMSSPSSRVILGSRWKPTPAGVLVKTKLLGSRVVPWERKEIRSGTENTKSLNTCVSICGTNCYAERTLRVLPSVAVLNRCSTMNTPNGDFSWILDKGG